MAYRGVVEDIPASLWRTIRGTFDFAGRSTRTDFWIFAIVPQMLVGVCLLLVEALVDLDFDRARNVKDVMSLAIMVPSFALFVRRLHDQDRTGWWVAVLVVGFAAAVISDNGHPSIPGIAKLETPWWLGLAFVAGIILVWLFGLLPPSEGDNRYGPNPRLDPVEAPA